MESEYMKAVITIVGRDQVGIVAMVSGILAANGVNVLNINQYSGWLF
jgi:ACT domain-containing protein